MFWKEISCWYRNGAVRLRVREGIQRVHPAGWSKLVAPRFWSGWVGLKERGRRRRKADVEDYASEDWLESWSEDGMGKWEVIVSRALSLLGTKFRTFLQRYFCEYSKSLVCQGDQGHSGHIQLFGNEPSSVPSSCPFFGAFRLTPHDLSPCLVPATPG